MLGPLTCIGTTALYLDDPNDAIEMGYKVHSIDTVGRNLYRVNVYKKYKN